jgi:alpha-L-rhamnosidase
MNSFNHYSLGSVGEWLFRHVAGIECNSENPGFQRFVLKPFVGPGLDFASATYRTAFGTISSHWRRTGDALVWDVRVPANCGAEVFIPAAPDTQPRLDGLEVLDRDDHFVRCHAEAGTYRFETILP